MKVLIYGINSFIGKNLYLRLKHEKIKVFCFNHDEINKLLMVEDDDIVINFCGVNHGKTTDDFYNGNYLFVKKMLDVIKITENYPFFIHTSSFMVHGFEEKNINDLPDNQKNFIGSKLEGEIYIEKNYPENKFAIIRPSNIYGYNCEPYYNNILVTLVYEKITQKYKTNVINKNCVRNFLSINGLVNKIMEIILSKKSGKYNILSNNKISLDHLIKIIYPVDIPFEISIIDGEKSITQTKYTDGENLIVTESLDLCINQMEQEMIKLLNLMKLTEIKKLDRLSQSRGDMVEISSLKGERLYMITLSENSIRGNHYHFEQIEDFYVARDRVIFLLAYKDNPSVVFFKILGRDESIVVKPNIIHTLVNDFVTCNPQVYVVSTQKFIKNEIPDTKYLNIIPY